MGEQFVYDDSNHTYYLGKKKMPSVTHILRSVGIYAECPFVSEDDFYIGKAAHKAIELHVKGTLDENILDPSLKPRVDAYRQFEIATGFQPYPGEIEKPRYNPLWLYGFMPDIIGVFPGGKPAIIDCKSGNVKPETAIQLAAYKHGMEELMPTMDFLRYGLKIGKDGKPVVEPFVDHKDESIWISALNIFSWIRNERGGKEWN